MTTDEVKGLLDTISDTFTFIDEDYSKELSDGIRELLSYVKPEYVKILADLLEIKEEKVNQNIADLKGLLDGFDKVFLTDQSVKIVDFCQRIKKRPLILRTLAWQLG